MNPYIQSLYTISNKNERIILGLMSGTSLDGLDLALCKISGSGRDTHCEVIAFNTVDYDYEVKKKILNVFAKTTVDLQYLTLLNPWIGELHAQIINSQITKWGISPSDIDLIASHGQTIFHSPKHFHNYSEFNHGTLQLGDGDQIAVATGIITISDFRQKHIAAGFEGAPLAHYGDYFLFFNQQKNTILLNIGGIANFTLIKKASPIEEVICSDLGPGNTMMDQFTKKYYGQDYDLHGQIAASGQINKHLLDALMNIDFINKPMPKTTGPELFNLELLEHCIEISEQHDIDNRDIMATLNQFTALTIVQHITTTGVKDDLRILVSGGGAHNTKLLDNIKQACNGDLEIDILDFNGINADSKEAALFAVLANECICSKKEEGGLTLGKISLPL
ncbi:hypothetical protein N474_19205 [Pseudoalteromonas luteoviolacea CPMOR-2]|nr:hypothetical protein N474_19205 [Pseudoalteromonas luteoviolacea CPMOR-2]